MDKILLIGGGGHCKSVIDVIEQEGRFTVSGIIDKPEKYGSEIMGYPVIGSDSDLSELAKKYKYAFITVGQIKSPDLRIKLYGLGVSAGFDFPTIISPRSYLSSHSYVGKGTILMHDVLVNANSRIGNNCIINSKALIEHDVVIKNHCHVSTGSIINGGSTIEDSVFFGSNSTSNQLVTIKTGSVLGSGSLVR